MKIYTIMKRYSNLDFNLKSHLLSRIFFIFDSVRYKEYLFKRNYGLKIKIKGYKTILGKKIININRIGNILLDFLNNSSDIYKILDEYRDAITEWLTDYKAKIFENYQKEIEDMHAEVSSTVSEESRDAFARYLTSEHHLKYAYGFFDDVIIPIFTVLSYDLLQISPYTIILIQCMHNLLCDLTDENQDHFNTLDFVIFNAISEMDFLTSEVDRIYTQTSTNKKGYVKYDNPIIKIPECNLFFKTSRKNSIILLHKYTIKYFSDLCNSSIYCLSLSKYKIYKCNICGKYFTDSKIKKQCSEGCTNKADALKKEKISNYRGKIRSYEAKHLYKLITGILNRVVMNKNEQNKRDKMSKNFNTRYSKKIKALDKRYNFNPDYKYYQRDLVIWLENEYKKVQEAFPSKRYGNKNRFIE